MIQQPDNAIIDRVKFSFQIVRGDIITDKVYKAPKQVYIKRS